MGASRRRAGQMAGLRIEEYASGVGERAMPADIPGPFNDPSRHQAHHIEGASASFMGGRVHPAI